MIERLVLTSSWEEGEIASMASGGEEDLFSKDSSEIASSTLIFLFTISTTTMFDLKPKTPSLGGESTEIPFKDSDDIDGNDEELHSQLV